MDSIKVVKSTFSETKEQYLTVQGEERGQDITDLILHNLTDLIIFKYKNSNNS